MLTISQVSNLEKCHKRGETTRVTTDEMSLAAAIELAYWRSVRKNEVQVYAAQSRIWRALRLLDWPKSSDFARAQNGDLVLQRLPSTPTDNKWTALKMEFMRMLRKNGFTNSLSSRVTGAVAELTNNIWDHSDRTETGLLAFEVRSQNFSLVIADMGIGILNSLRKNSLYSAIQTHKAAIEKALVPGVSRFEDTSRGMGFIDFLSIVIDLHGIARLRTGDVALTIDRRTEDENRAREYLIEFPGFHVSLYGRLSR
jgi:anti-sigma regulatory factor (Ser/Thr protein kinase)